MSKKEIQFDFIETVCSFIEISLNKDLNQNKEFPISLLKKYKDTLNKCSDIKENIKIKREEH